MDTHVLVFIYKYLYISDLPVHYSDWETLQAITHGYTRFGVYLYMFMRFSICICIERLGDAQCSLNDVAAVERQLRRWSEFERSVEDDAHKLRGPNAALW